MTRRTPVAAARPGFRSARLGGVAAVALLATACMADLGTLENGYSSMATGINNHNVVVGWSDVVVQTARVAFVRHPGEDMVALGGPYADSVAYAINDHGVIVGAAANAGELRIYLCSATRTAKGSHGVVKAPAEPR